MVRAALYNSINYATAMLVHSPQPHSLEYRINQASWPLPYIVLKYNRTKNKIRKIRCTKYQTQTKLQVTGQQQYKQQEKEKVWIWIKLGSQYHHGSQYEQGNPREKI